MDKTTTQSDLLIYAYNETKMADADRIQRSIDGDPLIAEDYREIIGVLETLDRGRLQPSVESIEKILLKARE